MGRVPAGTPSAKVCLTNLYNHTQPLIRYELTDRFVQVPGPHPDGHLRALVHGRRDDPFRYGHVEVHPFAVRSALPRFPGVFEYQVRQTETGIDASVVAESPIDHAAIERALTDALGAAGLPGATVTVRSVDAIPRDPKTGKVRRFVPLGC